MHNGGYHNAAWANHNLGNHNQETHNGLSVRGGGGGGPPAPLMMSSRFQLPGHGGSSDSNGTNTTHNSRLSSYNETGAEVTSLKVVYAGWKANSTNEQDGANAITITASIEYPSGTYTQITWDAGSTSKSVGVGDTVESDEISVTIPAAAQFWVRTFVSVSGGQVWTRGYVRRSALGESMQTGIGLSDATMGLATITNDSASAYGPLGVVAHSWNGPPRRLAIIGLGDSIVMGSGDGNADTHGNTGYVGRACGYGNSGANGLQIPYCNFGIAGHTARDNLPANFTRRLAAMQKLYPTHVFVNYGFNDLAASRSLAQIQGDLDAIWDAFVAEGWSVMHATIGPKTTSTDSWVTTANQTIASTPSGVWSPGDNTSRRSTVNDWLRTVPSPLIGVAEMADALETARYSGIFNVNAAWTTDSYTSDGTHPNVTSTAGNGEGGTYVMRDALETFLETTLSL